MSTFNHTPSMPKNKEGQGQHNNRFEFELQNLERSFLEKLDDLRRRQEEHAERRAPVDTTPPETHSDMDNGSSGGGGGEEEFLPDMDHDVEPSPHKSVTFDDSLNLAAAYSNEVGTDTLEINPPMKDVKNMNNSSLTSSNRSSGGFARRLSQSFKNFGFDKDFDSPIYNTGGIHMLLVLLVTSKRIDSAYEKFKRWMIALCSICIVLVQILVLFWVTFEASSPTCSMNEDCGIGEYCEDALPTNASFFRVPRCTDCANVPNGDFVSNCSDFNFERSTREALFWVSADSQWHPKSLYDDNNTIPCMKYIYCKETSIEAVGNMNYDNGGGSEEFLYEYPTDQNKCDRLTLNMAKFGFTHKCVFVFAAFLFAATLVVDIYESIIEEAILNHGCDKSERGLSPVELIRLSLRLRKFVLPWLSKSNQDFIPSYMI